MRSVAKPLNRALSVMNLKQTLDDDQKAFTMPASKRPKLTSAVELVLGEGPKRVVPPQSVTCKQLVTYQPFLARTGYVMLQNGRNQNIFTPLTTPVLQPHSKAPIHLSQTIFRPRRWQL